MFAFQVLAAGDEDQRLLHRRIVRPGAGGLQGVEEELRVREVGPLVLAVAGAAVGGVVLLRRLLLAAPLDALEKLLGILQ